VFVAVEIIIGSKVCPAFAGALQRRKEWGKAATRPFHSWLSG